MLVKNIQTRNQENQNIAENCDKRQRWCRCLHRGRWRDAGTGHKKEQKRSLIWRFNNTPAKAARERFKENHGHLQAWASVSLSSLSWKKPVDPAQHNFVILRKTKMKYTLISKNYMMLITRVAFNKTQKKPVQQLYTFPLPTRYTAYI
jgi:hypothetical protein